MDEGTCLMEDLPADHSQHRESGAHSRNSAHLFLSDSFPHTAHLRVTTQSYCNPWLYSFWRQSHPSTLQPDCRCFLFSDFAPEQTFKLSKRIYVEIKFVSLWIYIILSDLYHMLQFSEYFPSSSCFLCQLALNIVYTLQPNFLKFHQKTNSGGDKWDLQSPGRCTHGMNLNLHSRDFQNSWPPWDHGTKIQTCLTLLVDTPTVRIWKSYMGLFSSYHIHKRGRPRGPLGRVVQNPISLLGLSWKKGFFWIMLAGVSMQPCYAVAGAIRAQQIYNWPWWISGLLHKRHQVASLLGKLLCDLKDKHSQS